MLWQEQDHPDNFINKQHFLSSLRKNANFRLYTFTQLVRASTGLSQHLACIFIFLGVFIRLKNESLDPRILVWISISLFLFGYIIWDAFFLHAQSRLQSRIKAFKSSLLIFLSLMSLAPVLRTLTAATSSDSIWALSAFLFFLNALLADYTPMEPSIIQRFKLTSVLSMNAAISSSVVLASRLSTDLAVFSLILFSVQLFAMFPILRRRLQATNEPTPTILTIILTTTLILLNISISPLVTLIYCTSLLFVTIGAPAVLVWAQRYKNEIRGQWDVAVPKVNVN